MSGPPLDPTRHETSEPPKNFKDYLGDGAYIDMGSFMGEVVLTTEDGISVQNRVVLAEHEMMALGRWLRTHLPALWEGMKK